MYIVERLRACLRFDKPEPIESELELAVRDAAEILEEARRIFEDALIAIPDYMDGRNDPVVDSIEKWLRRTMK